MNSQSNPGPVGRAIRRTRIDQGLTQTDLAKALKVTQPRVSAMERGDNAPTLPQIRAIEDALGVSRGHILQAAGYFEPGDGEGPALNYTEVSAALSDAIDALEHLARTLGLRAERPQAPEGRAHKRKG